MPTQAPVAFECKHKGKPAGKVFLTFSRKAVPEGAFAGVLHVTVHKIDEFSDNAGLMDRTDPYVWLQLGGDKQQTSYKDNVRPCDKVEVLPYELCCSRQLTSESLPRLAGRTSSSMRRSPS